jgi:hypothetical protein
MSTMTIKPQNIADLGKSLNAHFHTARFAGVKTTTAGGVLRVKMPVSRLVQYQFNSTGQQCWWSNAKEKIIVQLRGVTVEQLVKKDMFHVVFKERQKGDERAPVQRGSAKDVFITRSLRAINELTRLDEKELVKAAQQPNDLGVLLSALKADDALTIQSDPLTGARLRGIEAKRRMLEEEGGSLTSAEAAELLKVSRQAIDKRRKEGKLLALELGKKGRHYPSWQFELRGLEKVLAKLTGMDSWQKLNFFLNPNDALGDRTPLQVLKKGQMEEVLKAAAVYGEQG